MDQHISTNGEPLSVDNNQHGYHDIKSCEVANPQDWKSEKAVTDHDRLDINGHPVMQRWETPYMAELAKVATSQGGRVLEVGYGLGISANAIQHSSIEEHIILEANAEVFQKLERFKANSQLLVTIVGPALWQDSLETIRDGSIDGILYDTYPLAAEEQHTHQFDFIAKAFKKMRPGGILTYCNLTSLGVLHPQYSSWEELFQKTQLPYLLKCGFKASDIDYKIVPATPPADCEYYQVRTALVPICKKSGENDSSANGAIAESQYMLSSMSNGFGNHEPISNRLGSTRTKDPFPQNSVVSPAVARARAHLDHLKKSAAQIAGAEAELAAIEAKEERQHAKWKAWESVSKRRVNAWTQWGALKEVVVGVADKACFIPEQPACHASVNKEGGSGATEGKNPGAGEVIAAELPWPMGPKKQATIDAANAQLDNLGRVLEERGIRVLRPDPSINWRNPLKTPFFEVPHQYCSTCGRDSLITLGNIIMEATMSRRDRYFEAMAYRDIISNLRKVDDEMLWKSAPKPTMRDEMYNEKWWDLTLEQRYKRMHDFEFCVTEDEPVFDAADITRCGKDIFVQLSMTCNRAGIDWLRKELAPHGFRTHMVRIPYDLAPSHLDCTFVPLRPGLVLTNPERPCMEEDLKIFKDNGWRFIEAPQPVNPIRPWASQSSKWLSMNVLVIGPDVVVVEEEETEMKALLESESFEVISVPFRDVYEFGGGLHCATWDIERDDAFEDFFPNQ